MLPSSLPRNIFFHLCLTIFIVFGIMTVFSLMAVADPRIPATLSEDYHGNHIEEFPLLLEHVKLLLAQAPLEISSKLGLFQYQPGFQAPVTIRFADTIHVSDNNVEPESVETNPAFLWVHETDGRYEQELVFNMEWYTLHRSAFDRLFNHEMTHVIINDTVGLENSQNIPHWVQEGLAIYITDNGDDILQKAIERQKNEALEHQSDQSSFIRQLVMPLDGPYSMKAQPQYYLAIKYMLDHGGLDALQAFTREIMNGRSVDSALQTAFSMDWQTFQNNVRAYSIHAVDPSAQNSL